MPILQYHGWSSKKRYVPRGYTVVSFEKSISLMKAEMARLPTAFVCEQVGSTCMN
jgi:hypothetical protein